MRFPLYAKILLWFFLNLVVLAAGGLLFFRAQLRPGLDSLLAGRAGDRIQAVANLITDELHAAPRDKWDGILQRFSDAYHVHFYLFRNTGVQVAGEHIDLPQEVNARLTQPPPAQLRQGPPRDDASPPRWDRPPDEQQPPPQDNPPAGPSDANRPNPPPQMPHPKSMMHTSNPSRYWVFVRIAGARPRPGMPPEPSTIITVSDTLSAGGLFFDPVPWLEIAGGAILVSALLWLPLVGGITRSISQMTRATEQIAEGRFEVRVSGARRDELGSLGGAINRMAVRLAGFVGGQKRFLGDIAHELCSPLARMQVALSILEDQDAGGKQAGYVADVREEVEHMSGLVNELLSFSKASLNGKNVALKPASLVEIVHRIIARENKGKGGIVVDVPPGLNVMADSELLARAIGNVVRNAIRYANPVDAEEGERQYTYRPMLAGKQGHPAGPIVISASETASHVILTIADNGPGISEEAIAHIFDPFFREDTSRARETGGVGLGLAIVKTCVESCGGTVTARNRAPSGLEVVMTLQKAEAA